MKRGISIIAAVGLGLTCAALADRYSDLAAQGYRWVTADGPYACNAEQELQLIAGHRTDATERQVVESIRCYYLIPGTIVQVITEDPAHGMSKVRLGSVTAPPPLWTYSKFLSKHPVQDIYGIIETPEYAGLVPKASTAVIPPPSNHSTPEF